MSTEEETKKLLIIRENLEKRIQLLENEIKDLRTTIKKVDKSIVQQGFQRPKIDIKKSQISESESDTEEGSIFSIKSKDGTALGRLSIEDETIVFTPKEDFKFKTEIPPFKSFFIDRVLENMKSTDEERAANGDIEPEQILNYSVKTEEGVIQSIIINNYGGKRRLREVRSSLRWALDKMYEKILG